MKAEKPGQLIQLDHMTVHFTEGVSLKVQGHLPNNRVYRDARLP